MVMVPRDRMVTAELSWKGTRVWSCDFSVLGEVGERILLQELFLFLLHQEQWQTGTCFLPRKQEGFRQESKCIYST